MSSTSPAVQAARSSARIDPRQAGDYPIILGESLKRESTAKNGLIELRYNWQPKSGFGSRQSTLTGTDDKYRLVVQDEDSVEPSTYVYVGRARPKLETTSHEPASSLALLFDKSKSVFVLENISASLDLNLLPGSSKAASIPTDLASLPASRHAAGPSKATNGDGARPSSGDENADPSNPFDFRHFLTEARENAEKAAQPPGNRTPVPGNRTPMSGFSSPVPAPHRYIATTPQFRPTPTSVPSQKKRKTDEPVRNSRPSGSTTTKPNVLERKATNAPTATLSRARISDSDEEMGDTITISRTKPSSGTSQFSKSRGHTRNASAGIGRSPHIVVNDGDLEIDLGSPPPEDNWRRRVRVDPGAFSKSHAATPPTGPRANASSNRNARKVPDKEVSMMDRDDVEEEEQGNAAADEDEDGDVEQLDLGSPRTSRASVPLGGNVSRIEGDDQDEVDAVTATAPTPSKPGPDVAADDDDEDLLAAELQAALEEEDNEAEHGQPSGVGLGISGASHQHHQHQQEYEDESEISEEE